MIAFQKLLGAIMALIGVIILLLLKDGFGILLLILGVYMLITKECCVTPVDDM